jgi:hypothetical protein
VCHALPPPTSKAVALACPASIRRAALGADTGARRPDLYGDSHHWITAIDGAFPQWQPWMRGIKGSDTGRSLAYDGTYLSSAGEEQAGEEAWHSLPDAWLRR